MRFSEEEVKALEENVAAEDRSLGRGVNRMRAQEGAALARDWAPP